MLFPVFLAGLAFSGDPVVSDPAATVYQFRHSRGVTVDTVYRSIASRANQIVITFEDLPNMTSQATCGMDFRIVSWHFKDRKTGYDVNAARTGDSIRISGKKGQKAIVHSYPIDSLPWYQSLEFSLEPFLRQGALTRDFWMIKPTDMSVFKMTARREATDTILVNGCSGPAVRVTLSPAGLAGRFWKGTYWYRSSDYCFLKCSLPQGIPGSSPIIVELMGKK